MAVDIEQLLRFSVKNGASDLHLSAGVPPLIRIDGDVKRINMPPLTHKEVHSMVYDIMNDKQRKDYEEFFETDFSFEIPELARFRVNAFNQHRGAGAAFRTIPSKIMTLDDLNAPKIFKDISMYPRGIVLVTGPTGSGKSTTLAAMIDHVNNNRPDHILTIEDPIEFVHESKKALINQREVHRDTLGFAEALRSALREDPDVILVGEMRDLETIRLALIKRSRFIATVAHASTEEDAKTFVSTIKKEFPDATHNCWAYVAGPPGDSARVGMSDDGEPHGTAGKPILTVLLHSEIGEVVAVVTRYFGGTKLETGGLVRAYSGSVKNALAGLSTEEKRDVITLTVILDYSKITVVKQMIESFDSKIIEEVMRLMSHSRLNFPEVMKAVSSSPLRF